MNKRPKGPHIEHLSSMNNLWWWIGQGGEICFLTVTPPPPIVRGYWILATCDVSSNSVQLYHKRSRSQSEAGSAILVFRSAKKKFGRGHWTLASRQVGKIPCYNFTGEIKMSQQIRGLSEILVFRSAKNHRKHRFLDSCQVSSNSIQ